MAYESIPISLGTPCNPRTLGFFQATRLEITEIVYTNKTPPGNSAGDIFRMVRKRDPFNGES